MLEPGAQLRRSRLAVPDLERAEVDPARILERLDEIVAGRGLAVVAFEIEIGAGAEPVGAKHGVEHADQLRALVVDRRGIEVRNLDIAVGPHWMGERSAVFRELGGAKHANILDPLDRMAAHVGGEALVAEDGEAFLQAELKPIAARNPVARPVVEIFVRDDPGDIVEVGVGRGVLVRQHIGGVEDVEALVLHRAHVEVADGDDVELVEVVLAAIDLLIPFHRGLEAGHGVRGLGEVGFTHPDGEIDLAPAHRGEAVAVRLEVAGDQGKEIARLGERVLPFRPVTAVRAFAGGKPVAVGQQDREQRRIAFHSDAVFRQNVGAVREEGDAAEAFGFALRAEHSARRVKAHKLGIGGGPDLDLGLDGRAACRNVDDELIALEAVVRIHAVQLHRNQLHFGAIEPKRAGVFTVALDLQRCADSRALGVEVEVEPDLRHQPVRWPVVLAADRDVRRGRRCFRRGLRVGQRGGAADIGHDGGLRPRRGLRQPSAVG